MKKKIRDLANNPTKENIKKLKKALKKEIKILDYLEKWSPRYYTYKIMLKCIHETMFWAVIFSDKMLDLEIEVE